MVYYITFHDLNVHGTSAIHAPEAQTSAILLSFTEGKNTGQWGVLQYISLSLSLSHTHNFQNTSGTD